MNFKLHKTLTINDSEGYSGTISVFRVISGKCLGTFIAVPNNNNECDCIAEYDYDGFLTPTCMLYVILYPYVRDNIDKLAYSPEEAIAQLCVKLCKNRHDIMSGKSDMMDMIN